MLYTVNTNPQALIAGQVIDIGSTIKRSGCTVKQNGDAISIDGSGLYRISGIVTGSATADGIISVTVYRDGQPIPGTTFSSEVLAGDVNSIPVLAIIKLKGCCFDEPTLINFVWSGAAGTADQIVTEVTPI